MSHTPGPWTLNGSSIEVPDRFNSGMSATLVHIYDERDIALDPSEIAANARLIAAAPELLDALKLEELIERLQLAHEAFDTGECIRLLEADGDYQSGWRDWPNVIDDYRERCRNLRRAAIAKATGGAQ